MKFLIAVVAIALAAFVGWKLYEQWQTSSEQQEAAAVQQVVPASQLPGMESSLEGILDQAMKRGPDGLRDFLGRYGKTIKDPRLASIELDYVVLVARENIVEARRVFSRVKQRTPSSSPIYPRVKQLEQTYN